MITMETYFFFLSIIIYDLNQRLNSCCFRADFFKVKCVKVSQYNLILLLVDHFYSFEEDENRYLWRFLDAFSHLYKRVCPSVGPSVGRSVRPSHTSWISEKGAEFEQNSIRNKKVCHLKDDSKTSTQAVSENASIVRTLFDLFS